MTGPEDQLGHIMESLKERAKELKCLYRVDELLSDVKRPLHEVMRELVGCLPAGWQFPDVCCARLRVHDSVSTSSGFEESPWSMGADILVEGKQVGEVQVYYTVARPNADEGPFLREERRLIQAIADRIGLFVMQQHIHQAHSSWETAMRTIHARGRREWGVILDFLRRTDQGLLDRMTRKMINHLCWTGNEEAETLLRQLLSREGGESAVLDENQPAQKAAMLDLATLTERAFEIASRRLGEDEVLSCIQEWIEEEKSGYLINTLENTQSGLAEIIEAVERFRGSEALAGELSESVHKSLRVSLLRRLFVDDLAFINVAKEYVDVADFYELLDHIVYPATSHGHLGGKSAGLFVSSHVVRKSPEREKYFPNLKVPKTWYVSSDAIQEFIRHNDLEELYNRKYMEIERVRLEYPHIVQVFINSHFPPELTKGLAAALDDFEDQPLIVRSSSLLEDQLGSAFSGKYKSLFLANQGTKKERLDALQDAIAEVYASVFSPDPIEYRAQRGLLDFHEEMGLMIQTVVGKRVGDYYLPAWAGVAFGDNEFRWSPRIKREDGIVRLVPGLGTRAVDRLADDYPVLLSPGQPGLRVNVSADEIQRYSPNKIDVINLRTCMLETHDVRAFLREMGHRYPAVRHVISIADGDRVRKPVGLEPDWEKDDIIVTFQGLIEDTGFVESMNWLLRLLRERLGATPDIEFACDGEDFYLLQCRSQSHSEEYAPAPIPQDVPAEQIVFSANRYISNGRVPDVSHIVYVDPEKYAEIESLDGLRTVGTIVGRLNQVLPKRQFVLIGPGRWGSRGDIKLGVHVTYSDINNAAALLEVARKKGNYVPELSFGTHFFQDLVESDIRYIPLYPDEDGNVFNERFLRGARNILPHILPRFSSFGDTVRVVDVPSVSDGRVLRVLLNADLDRALGYLAPPGATGEAQVGKAPELAPVSDEHWRWRLRLAERMAQQIDPDRFGVKAMYVLGSTKNATARPGSDLDLLLHVGDDEEKRKELALWLEGWSRSLAEMNYLRTGYRSDGLLDVHLITDDDIEKRTSWAVKIGAVTDAARPLPLRRSG
ncbi:MAG: pyruvate, phosphate dikinase [Candidatus Krumholzibacteria bacterium]|nr:pyruvate, phosphate dikinase [Candidatus Krumholzibacteria bacterium]